ncbi:MAG: hypothetical protein VX519_04885 [Myxococcota bacterium]|nr:hypothetical protein [Myxococcota bacterium]
MFLGCTPTEDKALPYLDSGGSETDSSTDTAASNTPTGCVRGTMRTFSNGAALANGPVRAFTHPPCVLRTETETNPDGSWCLDEIPVGKSVEIQVLFDDRCAWWHAQEMPPVPAGSCEEPETCREMETWYECYPVGGTASCL